MERGKYANLVRGRRAQQPAGQGHRPNQPHAQSPHKLRKTTVLAHVGQNYAKRFRHIPKRVMLVGLAAVVLISTFAFALAQWLSVRPAQLSAKELALVGEVRDDAKQYLGFDQRTQVYSFKPTSQNDGGSDQSQHIGRNADAFSAAFPSDASKGIAVTDTATKLTATLTPKFKTAAVKKQNDGHLIYNSEKGKLTYSLKYNGLKENIILPEAPKNGKSSYSFNLQLPAGVEARMENDGSIGIYSGDSVLFGDVSYGSGQDREKVEKARLNSAKTKLLMGIPAPIVKDGSGKEYSDKAGFMLSKGELQRTKQALETPNAPESLTTFTNYVLTLNAHDLTQLNYPIALDPTITVTSSGDFSGLNTNGVDVDATNNLIRRGSMTGGAVGSWTTDTGGDFSTARMAHGTVIYNGYIYVVGGFSSAGGFTSVQYAPINADPSTGVGTWAAATSLNNARNNLVVLAYNGYIYAIGGQNGGSTAEATVEYAKIKADGSLSTWASTTSLNSTRKQSSGATHNGYLYITGGINSSGTLLTSSEYVAVKADGTLGAWTTDAGGDFTTARGSHASAIYNGYLYVIAGDDGSDQRTDVQLAQLNGDGSIGTWRATTSLASKRSGPSITASNGYIYLMGGCGAGTCTSYLSEVLYGQINPDGSIASWRATSTISARWGGAGAYYKGYIYITGGSTTGQPPSAWSTTTQFAAIKPPGEIHGFSSTNANATARAYASSVAYNGFLYVAGGCTDVTGASGSPTNCTTATASVEYATINADGTLTWNGTTAALPSARWAHRLVAYNGYMYATGGCTVGGAGACTTVNDTPVAAINANGTLAAWSTDTDTYTTRRLHGFAGYAGYLYVIGGFDGTAGMTSVQKSQIQSDGTPGAWGSETALPAARGFVSALAYNGYVYIAGGSDNNGTATYSDVIYSSIDTSTGALGGSWNTNGTNLGASAIGIIPKVWNGYIYFPRGLDDVVIEYGAINSNGSVGPGAGNFPTTAGVNITSHDMAVIANGYFYAPGGCSSFSSTDCTGIGTTTELSPINNGGPGNISSWGNDATGNLSTAKYLHGVSVVGSYIYAIGGCTTVNCSGSSQSSTVEYASFNADGTLSNWAGVTGMPAERAQPGVTSYKGYIYVTGGSTSAALQNTVYYTKPTSTGTLPADSGCGSTWCTASTFSTSRSGHVAVAYNDQLYISGGCSAGGCSTYQSDVQHASINADGSLGAFSATTSLPAGTGVYTAGGLAYNGRFYMAGGYTSTGTLTGSVHYATFNNDGTLGSWQTAEGHIPVARAGSAVVAQNGYLYMVGGDGGGFSIGYVQYASILSSGDLGSWQQTTALTAPRGDTQGAAYGGRVYIVGGNNSGTLNANTYYATLQSMPHTGSFSKLYDFSIGIQPTKLITRGTKHNGAVVAVSYTSSNNASTTLDNNQNIIDTGYGGVNKQAISLGAGRTLSRYFWLRYTIDDSMSAVFPDVGSESTVTDFDVYFHPNSASRLKGGRTFMGGTDRGLDAQP